MLKTRKQAREFLKQADRKTFLDIVYMAKVTPREKEILYRHFLDGQDNGYIADILCMSGETVKAELQRAYDLIFNYLFKTEYIPK